MAFSKAQLALMKEDKYTAAQLAMWLGVTEQEVNALAERGVFPRLPDGRFDMTDGLGPYIEIWNREHSNTENS
jgi:hypothetical protein